MPELSPTEHAALEERLRSALSARADTVTPTSLNAAKAQSLRQDLTARPPHGGGGGGGLAGIVAGHSGTAMAAGLTGLAAALVAGVVYVTGQANSASPTTAPSSHAAPSTGPSASNFAPQTPASSAGATPGQTQPVEPTTANPDVGEQAVLPGGVPVGMHVLVGEGHAGRTSPARAEGATSPVGMPPILVPGATPPPPARPTSPAASTSAHQTPGASPSRASGSAGSPQAPSANSGSLAPSPTSSHVTSTAVPPVASPSRSATSSVPEPSTSRPASRPPEPSSASSTASVPDPEVTQTCDWSIFGWICINFGH